MFKSPKRKNTTQPQSKTNSELEGKVWMKDVLLKLGFLQQQLKLQKQKRQSEYETITKKLQHLQETKKSKVPLKYNKITQRKLYSPSREGRNFRENLSSLAPTSNEQIKCLKGEILKINENVDEILKSVNWRIDQICDQKISLLTERVDQIEIQNCQNTKYLECIQLQMAQVANSTKRVITSTMEKLEQNFCQQINELASQISMAKINLENTEIQMIRIVENVEKTVEISSESIIRVRNGIQEIRKQGMKNQIETNESIQWNIVESQKQEREVKVASKSKQM